MEASGHLQSMAVVFIEKEAGGAPEPFSMGSKEIILASSRNKLIRLQCE
jgi:hypothetical protein